MIRTIHFEDTAVPAINKYAGFHAQLKINREAAEARRSAPVIAPEILKAEYLLKQIQGQSFLFGRYGRHHSAVLNSATSLVQIETDKLPALTPEQMTEFENLYPVPQSIPEGKPLPALTGPIRLTALGEGRSSEKSFKSLAQDADAAHKEYLADKLSLSDFMDIAYELLEHNSATDSVVEFLASIHHELEDKKFGLGQKFSNALMHAYKAHGANQGISTRQAEQQEHLEASGEEFEATEDVVTSPKKSSFADLKNQQAIDKLNSAYAAYIENKNDVTTKKLFEQITAYALKRIENRVFDVFSGGQTPADVAQQVTIHIWKTLDRFRGTPAQFFAWVGTQSYLAGNRLFTELKAHNTKFCGLTVQLEDGSVDDNPEMYREYKQEYIKKLPTWIMGTDLSVCKGIRAGMTYKEIAEELGISESGVKLRCHRMKLRILAEKEVRLASKQ